MKGFVPPGTARRLPGIEGLRGVAAASVLTYHVWSHASPAGGPRLGGVGPYVLGNLAHGVTLFFVLSGFLLYLPFVSAAMREQSRPSLRSYLRNRALRILPAYWAILLLVSFGLQTAVLRAEPLREGALTDPEVLVADALLVQNYRTETLSTGIGPAWSLAVELVFYLVLPLLVLGMFALARRARTRRGRGIAALVPPAVLGFVGLGGSVAGGIVGGVLDHSFLAYAHLFTVGMALAVGLVAFEDGGLRLPAWWRPAAAVSMAGLMVAGVVLTLNPSIPERIETILFSAASGLLLALVVFPRRRVDGPGALIRALESVPVMTFGLMSYGVYLWHRPLITFLARHGITLRGGGWALLANVAIVLAVTSALSWVTYRLVERPALRWKIGAAAARRELAATPAP
jgi:peptidoglycan/LPS O-acetylase OafA/YrhL